MSGTSMAAPMVTAVCGLTWSANKALSGAQVVDLVMGNTSVTSCHQLHCRHQWRHGHCGRHLAVSAAVRTRGTDYGYVVDATNNNALANATVKLHKGNKNGPCRQQRHLHL